MRYRHSGRVFSGSSLAWDAVIAVMFCPRIVLFVIFHGLTLSFIRRETIYLTFLYVEAQVADDENVACFYDVIL